MVRLTVRDKKKNVVYFNGDDGLIRGTVGKMQTKAEMTNRYIHDRFVALDKCLMALAEYEDAKEQARLIILPTAVDGGELFLADYHWGDVKRMTTGGIQLYCAYDGLEGSCMVPLSVIGKTVFLTREEAETALAKHTTKK